MSTSQGILCTIPLYYYIISFDTGRTKYYLMTIFTVSVLLDPFLEKDPSGGGGYVVSCHFQQ
jgi:hypothetical protein